MKFLWEEAVYFMAITFCICLIYSCTTPIYKEVTSTTALKEWHDQEVYWYWKDLQNPPRAVMLPDCQGIAAKEYYRLKVEGYNACVLAGYKKGRSHVQATVFKNDFVLDLCEMQVTYVMTDKKLWSVYYE